MATPDLVPLAALRPALPVHVTDAIDRGLAPDPEARGLTAEEMASLLRSVVDVEAAREQLAEKIARLRRRESQQAITSRPPPPTSMVVPRMEVPRMLVPSLPVRLPIPWETSSPMISRPPTS